MLGCYGHQIGCVCFLGSPIHNLPFGLHGARSHGLRWTLEGTDSPSKAHQLSALFSVLDFDGTLGYLGKVLIPQFLASLLDFYCLPCTTPLIFLVAFVAGLVGCHGMIAPRTPGDWTRQGSRKLRPPLPAGRPVTDATAGNRERLIRDFFCWCARTGWNIEQLLLELLKNVEQINRVLQLFGRRLYEAGKPYSAYIESINSIVSYRPVLRRQLQPAWDLVFAWVRGERPVHHLATPWQILPTMLSVALAWGWVEVAGVLSLRWGALLRTSQMTGAFRKDLLLPSDTLGTNNFLLLSLQEPKTRFVAARHQYAKCDIGDLVRVCELAFKDTPRMSKIWPFSSHTFRLRFKDLLGALQLQTGACQGRKSLLDVGSLRPGGATWQLQVTENASFVQHWGRWINAKVMEIYIQEVGSTQYLLQLTDEQRKLVVGMAKLFPALFERAEAFRKASIPPSLWFPVISRDKPGG